MKKINKLVLLLAGPIVICIGVFFLVNVLSPHRQSSSVVLSSPSYTNKWAKANFTAIQDSADFRSSLSKVRKEGTYQMGAAEASALNLLLFDFLFYHQSDEFDYYRKFRFGSPEGQFVKSVVDFDRARLARLGLTPPAANEDLIEQFWEHVEIPERKRVGGQWADIALQEAILTVDTLTYWPAPLSATAAHQPNASILTHFSYYAPRPTPEELLKQNGHVVVALFQAIIRQANQTSSPVYLRSYLEPQTRKWIPWEFVTSGTTDFFNSIY